MRPAMRRSVVSRMFQGAGQKAAPCGVSFESGSSTTANSASIRNMPPERRKTWSAKAAIDARIFRSSSSVTVLEIERAWPLPSVHEKSRCRNMMISVFHGRAAAGSWFRGTCGRRLWMCERASVRWSSVESHWSMMRSQASRAAGGSFACSALRAAARIAAGSSTFSSSGAAAPADESARPLAAIASSKPANFRLCTGNPFAAPPHAAPGAGRQGHYLPSRREGVKPQLAAGCGKGDNDGGRPLSRTAGKGA